MSDSVARGAANPQTIREHLEALIHNNRECQWEHADGKPCAAGAVAECDHCFNRQHAVAALDLLGQSRRAGLHHTSTYRLVLDPAPRGDADA